MRGKARDGKSKGRESKAGLVEHWCRYRNDIRAQEQVHVGICVASCVGPRPLWRAMPRTEAIGRGVDPVRAPRALRQHLIKKRFVCLSCGPQGIGTDVTWCQR